MSVLRLGPGARRILSGCVAALLAVVLLTPLWSTRMESPQYRGDEALHVYLRLNRVEGDLHEIELLNQYVGVNMPLDAPELRIAPWWTGAVLVLALAAALVPAAYRRRVVVASFVLMVAGIVAGVASLQHRLYEMGHDRTRSPFARIDDFTPPLLGHQKVANFEVTTRPEAGGWALAGAFVLAAWAAAAPERVGSPAGGAPETG